MYYTPNWGLFFRIQYMLYFSSLSQRCHMSRDIVWLAEFKFVPIDHPLTNLNNWCTIASSNFHEKPRLYNNVRNTSNVAYIIEPEVLFGTHRTLPLSQYYIWLCTFYPGGGCTVSSVEILESTMSSQRFPTEINLIVIADVFGSQQHLSSLSLTVALSI